MAILLDNRVRRCSISGTHLFRWRCEVHYPFYDHEFFDHVAALPHEWRHRHRLYVEMIRRCFPAVGAVPWQRTGLPAHTGWPLRFCSAVAHRLNERISRRLPRLDVFRGRHVARFDEWFRGPLRGFVERTLCDGRFAARGLVRPEGVRWVLQRHQAGADHHKLIGVLVALELFHRLFVDDLPAAVRRFGAGLDPAENGAAMAGTRHATS